MISRTGTGRRGSAETAPYRPCWVDRRRLGLAAIPGRRRRLAVEIRDDRAAEREGVLVVERLVVGDARLAGVDLGAAQLLGRDVLAGRGLHQRRAAEEDRAGALDDHGLVAHRRDVGATGRATAHDQRDLRDGRRRHAGLVVEDAAEVVAVREDLGLEREECAAAVDEVDARQPVLERDLLGAQVLLDGHRVVRAALDRRVVGDDDAGRALDAADAGDDAGARGVVVVQAGRRRAGSARGTAEPGSRSRSMRSRTGSLPRSRWRSIDRSSPPAPRSARSAWRWRRSSTRAAIASWFARVSAAAGSSRLRRTGMARMIGSRTASRGRRGNSEPPAVVPRPCSTFIGSSWPLFSFAIVAACQSIPARGVAGAGRRPACHRHGPRRRMREWPVRRHDGHRTGRPGPSDRAARPPSSASCPTTSWRRSTRP